ncbi:DUF1652 domain-containing protein [Pseudomonas putida]|uniref:DUF1652 domain-containing protein n=1 Tax=Pseudomonas putida TaxID=303 RepID=A0A1Q9R726_PSEPU|nr:DUF1652 domain-containing protein [Pseudomonas putida]OLS63082.1 hypothetical protein PSEMO_20180 [Pseudomonas putida]
MPMNGVCDLELRQLIEGAFLPDHCQVSCGDGMSLTLYFPADASRAALTVRDIQLSELPNCRALAELVSRVRRQRDQAVTPHLLTGR